MYFQSYLTQMTVGLPRTAYFTKFDTFMTFVVLKLTKMHLWVGQTKQFYFSNNSEYNIQTVTKISFCALEIIIKCCNLAIVHTN